MNRIKRIASGPSAVYVVFFLLSLGMIACQENQLSDKSPVTGNPQVMLSSGFDLSRELKSLPGKADWHMEPGTIQYFEMPLIGSEPQSQDVSIVEEQGPFTIVDWGPEGELPAENRRPTVYLTFSHPLIPLAKLGAEMRESTIFHLEPAVPGVYRWQGSRTLAFVPDEAMTAQLDYTIHVDNAVKSLGGKTLDDASRDFSFTFFRERLAITAAFPGEPGEYISPDEIPTGLRRFTLQFNAPVDAEYLRSFIVVATGDEDNARLKTLLEEAKEQDQPGTETAVPAGGSGFSVSAFVSSISSPVSFIVARPDMEMVHGDENLLARSILLEFSEPLPENQKLTIALLKGAGSQAGYKPTDSTQIKEFHTITPFRYETYRTRSYAFPKSAEGNSNPVYLEFSHTVDPESVASAIRVSIPVENLASHLSVYRNIVRLNNLPVDYESSYEITLGAGIKDSLGRELGNHQTLSIEVPAAASFYYFPDQGSRMLEAQYPPKIIFEYQNIESAVWKAGPITNAFAAFDPSTLELYDTGEAAKNTRFFKVVDLKPYLNSAGKGWVGFAWNFSEPDDKGVRNERRQVNLQLQVTDLGITTRYGYNQVLVWVRSLTDNRPVAGASVSLLNHQTGRVFPGKAVTDAGGLGVIDLGSGDFKNYFTNRYGSESLRIHVEKDDDVVEFRPNYSHNTWASGVSSSGHPQSVENEKPVTFIFSDRGLYKPGETVTFRGIDRTLTAGEYHVYRGGWNLSVKEDYWKSEPIIELSGETSETGGFYGSFTLPEDTAPGVYFMNYSRPGTNRITEQVGIQVAYFRRAAFSVTVTPPAGTFTLGDDLNFGAGAEYLSGGAMAGAALHYDVTRQPVSIIPPGTEWQDMRFGPYLYGSGSVVTSGEKNLDATGSAGLQVTADANGIVEGRAQQFTLEARVQDVDSQELSGRASLVAHPAALYAGMRLGSGTEGWWSTFVESGKPVQASVALVTPDGRIAGDNLIPPSAILSPDTNVDATGDVASGESTNRHMKKSAFTAELVSRTWKVAQQQGVYGTLNTRYERVDEILESLELGFSQGRAQFEMTPPNAGSYLIRVRGSDRSGRSVVTEISLYATGASFVRWGADQSEEIKLVPDKETYRIGDTARLLAQTPIPAGRYLLTMEREGLLDHRFIDIEGSATVLEIPISESYLPIVYVTLSTSSRRQEPPASYFEPDLGKPKGYFGVTALYIDTSPRRFDVEIRPGKSAYQPGEEAEVELFAGRNGEPLSGAELTFMAVDRGVLDLIDYHVADPVAFFYDPYNFPLCTRGADSRSLLIDPVTYEVKNLQGGDAGEEDKLGERKDFRPTAIFEPYLRTDVDGRAVVKFTLPDSLTTYRMTVVGVTDNLLSLSEDEIRVSNPITMRAGLPRNLRVRDTAKAGVVLTNLSAEPKKITVHLEAQGILVDGDSEKSIDLEPGESAEIPFQLAALSEGTAELVFTMMASGSRETPLIRDRLRSEFEISRPLTPETTSVFGSVQGVAEEGLIIPSAIARHYGELRIQVDPGMLSQIAGSVEELKEIWYRNLSSRVHATFPDLLLEESLFLLTGTKADEQAIGGVIKQMAGNQHSDGGFVEWPEYLDRENSPVSTTLRAAHFLAETSRLHGLAYVTSASPALDLKGLHARLAVIGNDNDLNPSVRAMALYLKTLLFDDTERTEIVKLVELGDDLGMDGYGMLALSAWRRGDRETAAALYQRMKNFVRFSGRSVDFIQSYEQRNYFDAPARRLALLALLSGELGSPAEQQNSILRTIVAELNHGYWGSHDDRVWAMLALTEPASPAGPEDASGDTGVAGTTDQGGEPEQQALRTEDLPVTVELADQSLLRHVFPDETAEPAVVVLPLDESPLDAQPRNTVLPLRFTSDEDAGALNYTALLRYALPDEIIPARDEGFSVFTWVEDLQGNTIDWDSLDRGETYRMQVRFESPSQRYNAALRLPLPSGAEVLDSSFVTSGRYAAEGGTGSREWTRETQYGDELAYSGEGYARWDRGMLWLYPVEPVRRIYDAEVQYYFGVLYPGSQTLGFLFRATSPGIYPVPPATIELIDEPEVFGRTKGELSVIRSGESR